MNMEIQIDEKVKIFTNGEGIIIYKGEVEIILWKEQMEAIVEAYLKEKYPVDFDGIKFRIDQAKEYQRVVAAIYATENPKTSENG